MGFMWSKDSEPVPSLITENSRHNRLCDENFNSFPSCAKKFCGIFVLQERYDVTFIPACIADQLCYLH